jgi:hypothetical protein
LRVRPLERRRKVHPAVWVGIGISLVVIIFAVAWFVTTSSKKSNPYLREVFENMEALKGWESDVRVDTSGFGMDSMSYSLFGSWEGQMVYQAPDRFSLSARSLDGQYSYEIRVISDTIYENDSYTNYWTNLGPATEEHKQTNPIWDYTLVDELSPQEEEGLEEINGHMCKVYAFDEDITVEEEGAFDETYEMVYRVAGKFYVDDSRDLLVSLDYIVDFEDFGRSHYRYDFYSFDEYTSVEVPPGV